MPLCGYRQLSGKDSGKGVFPIIAWLYRSDIVGYCNKAEECNPGDTRPNMRFYFRDLGVSWYFLKAGGIKENAASEYLSENFVYIYLLKRNRSIELSGISPMFGIYKTGKIDFLVGNIINDKTYGFEVKAGNCLAMKNTPILLPSEIKTMKEIMCGILKGHLEELEMGEMVDDLLDFDSQKPTLYVLSNIKQINGAGCILYDGCLKNFADSQNSDIVILPSSLHETILVPDDGQLDYGELRKMVSEINESDVPEEDVLSDRVYKYSRHDCSISLIE